MDRVLQVSEKEKEKKAQFLFVKAYVIPTDTHSILSQHTFLCDWNELPSPPKKAVQKNPIFYRFHHFNHCRVTP